MNAETKEADKTRDSEHFRRTLIALAVPAIVLVMLFPLLWSRSQTGTTESTVSAALASSLSRDELARAAASQELQTTDDTLQTILLLVVGTSDTDTLQAAALIALNTTQSTAKLIELPTSLTLSSNGTIQNLKDVYANGGMSATVESLSANALVPIDHLATLTKESYSTLLSVINQGSSAVTYDAASMLEGVETTDMDLSALKAIVTSSLEMGFGPSSIVEAPANTTEQIGILVGTVKA